MHPTPTIVFANPWHAKEYAKIRKLHKGAVEFQKAIAQEATR
jgi:hypothetical protein